MSATAPDLVVLVPTWHGGALLGRCLDSLAAQTLRPAAVVVIVSNPAGAPIPATDLPVRVIHPGRQTHYGEAVNLGFADTSGDCVVLNDDTWAAPDFLAALDAARRAHPGAILQPRIRLGDGDTLDNAGHHLFPDGLTWARGRGRPDGPAFDPPATLGAFSGAAFLLPRAVLDRVGPFDPALGPYAEDLDLSLRAARRGVPIRYVPDARIAHALGASYGRTGPQKLYRIERNRVRAAVRSLPLAVVVALPALTVARWGLLSVARAGGGGDREVRVGLRGALAAAAGSLAGWRHTADALRKRAADRPAWTHDDAAMGAHLWRERVRLDELRAPAAPR